MAAVDFISETALEFEESLLLAKETFAMLAAAVADGDTPSWLFVLGRQFDDVEAKGVRYMAAVYQHAMPLMRDMAAAANSIGDMGANAPMLNVGRDTRPTKSAG